MSRKRQQSIVKKAGYDAAMGGFPCEAPYAGESDRGAWEQGWRAGKIDYDHMHRDRGPIGFVKSPPPTPEPSPTYRSIDANKIQKIFALAFRLSKDPNIGDRERKYFAAITYEIWKACEGDKPIPSELPQMLYEIGNSARLEIDRT